MTALFALSTPLVILLALLGLAAFVLLFGVGIYNSLVTLRNRYKNAFSQIDVQLKRRYDLIPNLVEAAKGYMKHESETLEAVIQAPQRGGDGAADGRRANPGDPAAMSGLAAAEGQLNGALGRLFALAEAYPDLKANQNMLALQEELSSTENKVAFARQAYNDAVMQYNTQRETFPAWSSPNFLNFTGAALRARVGQGARGAQGLVLTRGYGSCSDEPTVPVRRSATAPRAAEIGALGAPAEARISTWTSSTAGRRAATTGRLVVYFVLAVVLIIATVYLAVAGDLCILAPSRGASKTAVASLAGVALGPGACSALVALGTASR